MSAPSSYKPSDMIQSMEVKISTFTQQFTQTQIDSLQLGKKNEIRLTNQAMVNYVRNSNLSSLTPSIEITPKYTILNQQTSGLGGQPPAIANAGALNTKASTYMQTTGFNGFTDMVSGSSTYGQTITFASTNSIITGIAVDSSGYYVCIGVSSSSSNQFSLELHRFQLVTTTTKDILDNSYSYSLNRINYAIYTNLGFSVFGGILPQIAIQSNSNNPNVQADYVIVVTAIMNHNYNVCFHSVSSQSWGSLTPLPLFNGNNYIDASTYTPISITIDAQNNLHVVEGVSNNIYSYAINNNCTQIASTENGNNIFGGVALNFGLTTFLYGGGIGSDGNGPSGIIAAAAKEGTITVVDTFNGRILNLSINTTEQNYYDSNASVTASVTAANSAFSQFTIAFDTNGLLLTINANPTQTEIYNSNYGIFTNMLIYSDNTLTTTEYTNTSSLIMCNMGNFAIDSNGNIVFANNPYIMSWNNGPFNGLSIATPYASF